MPTISVGPIGLFLYAVMLLGSFYTTYRYGVGRMFAWFFVPATLLFFNIPAKKIIPALPFLSTPTAIGYGTILGLVFRLDQVKKIRWNVIDTAMVLMLIPIFCSACSSQSAYEAYRYTFDYAFIWCAPYFFARIALQDADARPRILKALCICAIIIAFLAAYEARLSPNATPRFMIRFGLTRILSGMVLFRWGLARAMVTMAQPIDLGNVGVIVGGLILLLTPASGKKWNQPLPLAGILASGAMVFGSISLTAWGATVVSFMLYFLFSRRTGWAFVVPILLTMAVGLTWYTSHALNTPLADEKPDDPVLSSQWIRLKIIHDSWDVCATSGWFGYGTDLDTSHIGVGSIDNSYLLFIMQQGWFSLCAWIVFDFVLIIKAAAALKRTRTLSERLPMAAATAGVMAIFFAMYTVFYGFVYATMLCVAFGFLSTMCQMLTAPRATAVSTGFNPGYPMAMPNLGGAR